MARERMVTRTVTLTKGLALCMDINTCETVVKEIELSGDLPTADVILKKAKKVYETDTFKVVTVRDIVEQEVLYGMPEQDFIKLAKVLPPRGTKTDIEE